MTKEEKKEANRKYYLKNKDKIKEQTSRYKEETGYNKKYYVQNSDKIKEQSGQYREDNKEYYKEYGKNYKKNRMKVDPIYKLNCGISRSIGTMMRKRMRRRTPYPPCPIRCSRRVPKDGSSPLSVYRCKLSPVPTPSR